MGAGRKYTWRRTARLAGAAIFRFGTALRLVPPILAAGFMVAVLLITPASADSEVGVRTGPGGALAASPGAGRVSIFKYRQYTGLPEMVTAVCREAGLSFRDFFGPDTVAVQPFVFLTGSGEKKFSPMGATLADQMIAMINNGSKAGWERSAEADAGPAGQELKGVLLEMDGYLRIHMHGVNGSNQHRSYTAQVEMSEALYRSLYADTF